MAKRKTELSCAALGRCDGCGDYCELHKLIQEGGACLTCRLHEAFSLEVFEEEARIAHERIRYNELAEEWTRNGWI